MFLVLFLIDSGPRNHFIVIVLYVSFEPLYNNVLQDVNEKP